MKCPKCQFENPADSGFCGKCGTRLFYSHEEPVSPAETLPAAAVELTIGSTFASRYQIIEELGRGGMGNVYKVFDRELGEKMALKLLKPEISAEETVIERFRNELRFARKITHKNVCRMFDLNKEQNLLYITMEYVSGEDLKTTLRRVGPLSPGKATYIAQQVCAGLAEAHKLGVIHRDLKPQNIMIDKHGNPHIMDFGVARSMRATGLTTSGMMIGTPEYMSPEQVEGREVDQRSDIYALGIILYEMVAGRTPFQGETALTVAFKHLKEKPQDPRQLNSQVPPELSRLILKCMEKEKIRRYQTIEELLAELERIEKGMPTTDRVMAIRPGTSKAFAPPSRLKQVLVPVLTVIALAAAGTAAWYFTPLPEMLGLRTKEVMAPPGPDVPLIDQKARDLKTRLQTPAREMEREAEPAPPGPPEKTEPRPEPEKAVPSKLREAEPPPSTAEKAAAEASFKLDRGINLFNREDYDGCIKLMEEVLKLDPRNSSARYFLSEARKRKQEKTEEQQISDGLSRAQNAFQAENYQECLTEARKVLNLVPDNARAKEYIRLANEKIAPGEIQTLIGEYLQALNSSSLLAFYERNCTPQLFQRLRKDTELVSTLYQNIRSAGSNIKVELKDSDRAEASFSHIITGETKAEGRKLVLFEGIFDWTLEKQAETWKIAEIRTQSK